MLAVSLPAATYEVAQRHPQASDDASGSEDRLFQGCYRTARGTGHPNQPAAGAPAGATNDAYLPDFLK